MSAGSGCDLMEQQSRVAEQIPRAQQECQTLHHGLQPVQAALTRYPSAKAAWRAQKKGALVPLVVQEA